MKTRQVRFSGLVVMVATALTSWTPEARAYPTYGGCEACHDTFDSGTYVSADGQDWGTNLMSGHNQFVSNDCDVCHTGAGFSIVNLDSSNGGAGLEAISCLGCHGRAETAAGGAVTGAGLRQHHWKSGVTTCGNPGCHPTDSNPSGFTTVGESVLPPYYANPGTQHPNMPTDPCNPSPTFTEDVLGNGVGLDNDGDDVYDGSDSDCVVAITTTTSTTTTTLLPLPRPIAGKKLLIKNKFPDKEKKNKIVIVAKDSNVSAGEVGSSADPRCVDAGGSGSGGTLTVSSLTSGQSHSTNLPCQNWKRIGKDPGTGNAPKAYKYTDKQLDDGTCKVVIVKNARLVKVLCLGKGPTNLDYDLEEGQTQAPVDVVLTTGTRLHCAQFGGKVSQDGSNGKIFKAAAASAPQSCP